MNRTLKTAAHAGQVYSAAQHSPKPKRSAAWTIGQIALLVIGIIAVAIIGEAVFLYAWSVLNG